MFLEPRCNRICSNTEFVMPIIESESWLVELKVWTNFKVFSTTFSRKATTETCQLIPRLPNQSSCFSRYLLGNFFFLEYQLVRQFVAIFNHNKRIIAANNRRRDKFKITVHF